MSIYQSRLKAPQWEDLRFSAVGINPPGAASDPTRDTTDGRLVFAAAATNIIALQAQFPHQWKEGSSIEAHIHWSPSNNDTGNVLWKMQYQVANVNGVFPGVWTPLEVLSAGAGVAETHQMATFEAIDMTGKTVSNMMLILISRIGGDGTDTFTGTAKLAEFDIHYQIDTVGSRTSTRK